MCKKIAFLISPPYVETAQGLESVYNSIDQLLESTSVVNANSDESWRMN